MLKPLGQFFVRVGLMLTGKEKQGREQKEMTQKEICTKYLQGVSEIMGRPVVAPEWDDSQAREAFLTFRQNRSHAVSATVDSIWATRKRKG